MQGNGIAIAGIVAVDELVRVERYPKKSELSPIHSIGRSIGGAIGNCSIALANIDSDLPIEVLTYVGEDALGEYLKQELGRYPNIILDHVETKGNSPFTIVVEDDSDRTRTFFTFKGNSVLLDENFIDFDKVQSKILHIAYILLLDSLDQEDQEFGTKMARLLKQARERGIKTSIDIVSEDGDRYQRVVPPSLKYTSYCVINEIEAGKTAGISLRDGQGKLYRGRIKDVLSIIKEYGVEEWVVIHTPEGSFGYDGDQYYSIPSLKIEKEAIKGTVGAGDAFVSGVLYGALNDVSLPKAMEIGTATAASSLFEDGTKGVKDYDSLLTMLKHYPRNETIIL